MQITKKDYKLFAETEDMEIVKKILIKYNFETTLVFMTLHGFQEMKTQTEEKIDFLFWLLENVSLNIHNVSTILEKFTELTNKKQIQNVISKLIELQKTHKFRTHSKQEISNTLIILEDRSNGIFCKCKSKFFNYPEFEKNMKIISTKTITPPPEFQSGTLYNMVCEICGTKWETEVYEDYERKNMKWKKVG